MIKVRNQQLINALGIRIRTLRKQKQLSMERLAELAEIEYSQLSNLELGKTNATVSMLYSVCSALEITITELFDSDSLK